MSGPGPQDLDVRQGWIGVRYTSVLASQAGYPFSATPSDSDVHSFDGEIKLHPGSAVEVQIKTTRKPIKVSRSYKIEDAWAENWRCLMQPAYFVVVVVDGDDPSRWVEQRAADSLLRMTAYWARLDTIDYDQTRSVQVLAKQRLTDGTMEEWRQHLLDSLRHGYGGGL